MKNGHEKEDQLAKMEHTSSCGATIVAGTSESSISGTLPSPLSSQDLGLAPPATSAFSWPSTGTDLTSESSFAGDC